VTNPTAPRRTQKLATILGLLDAAKREAHETASRLYKLVQKPDLFAGHRRSYEPLTQDQDEVVVANVVPVEQKKVQLDAETLLKQVAGAWARFYDLQHTMDAADQGASADVVVDGAVLMSNVPVTTLLFLEKRLDDLRAFVAKLPVLDSSKDWSESDVPNVFRSDPVSTATTKKIRRHKVTVQPTQHQPAQVDIWNDDVPIGAWTRVEFSGGVTARRYAELMTRVDALRYAVKIAREEANRVDAPDRTGAERVFRYVIEGTV
jgi:hypothetical protein